MVHHICRWALVKFGGFLIQLIRWLLLYGELLPPSSLLVRAECSLQKSPDSHSGFRGACFVHKTQPQQKMKVNHELNTPHLRRGSLAVLSRRAAGPAPWARRRDPITVTAEPGRGNGVVSLLPPRISSSRTNISSKQHLSSSRRPRRSRRSSSSRTAPKPTGRPAARARAPGARAPGSSTARTPASTRCLQTRNHA